MRKPIGPFQREGIKDKVGHVEQEARMVLPGIQALFGFQFVVVFNQQFSVVLNQSEQVMHWVALAMTALATLLTLAPAAYHRQAEPDIVSEKFVKLSTWWLTTAMVPLMLGICLDFYLIGKVILHSSLPSAIVSILLLTGFVSMWFVVPAYNRFMQEANKDR